MANNTTEYGHIEVCDFCGMEFPEDEGYEIPRGVFCSLECGEDDLLR